MPKKGWGWTEGQPSAAGELEKLCVLLSRGTEIWSGC